MTFAKGVEETLTVSDPNDDRIGAVTASISHDPVDQEAELASARDELATSKVYVNNVLHSMADSLLVIDANTGQNGMAQAKEFLKAGAITGLVLTKLDGTAKGGVAVGVSRTLGIPLKYIGVGEAVDDLLDFSLGDFVEGLLAGDEPGRVRA